MDKILHTDVYSKCRGVSENIEEWCSYHLTMVWYTCHDVMVWTGYYVSMFMQAVYTYLFTTYIPIFSGDIGILRMSLYIF